MDEVTKRVFISHSSKDKPFVRRLAAELSARGISVWVDEAELHFGDSLVAKISEAIEGIRLVLAVISKNSIDSNWVRQELDWAMTKEINQRRVTVIPVLVDKCDIPFFLLNKLYADFTEEDAFRATVTKLSESIRFHECETANDAARAPLGCSANLDYDPCYAPLVVAIMSIVFGAVLFLFANLCPIFPTDPARSVFVSVYLTGFALLFALLAMGDTLRVLLVRYQMRVNPNFKQDAGNIHFVWLFSCRYRRLMGRYCRYHLVKVILLLDILLTVGVLVLFYPAVRLIGAILLWQGAGA